MGAGAGRWIEVAAFGLLLAALPASAEEPEEPAAHGPSTLVLRARVPIAAAAAAQLHTQTRPSGFTDAGLGVSVVELPPEGAQLGPQRRHHAISFGAEGPKQFLRSLGLDAADCSTRIRFPSRLRQTTEGIKAEVRGQVQFGCSY